MGALSGTHLTLLNGFAVTQDGRPRPIPASATRLVAYLGLQHQPVPRSRAAGVLWPNSSQDHAFACLRSTLWRLRKVLPELIQGEAEMLWIGAEVEADVDLVIRVADTLASGHDPDEGVVVPLGWFAHELLPDWDDDWVYIEREHFRMTALHALEQMSASYRRKGQFAQAIESALAAIAVEPMRESPRRALVAAFLAEGNISDALAHVKHYTAILDTELGVAPSAQLTGLVANLGLARASARR